MEGVRDQRAGAVVAFVGTVRSEEGVEALHYEAYDGMAASTLEKLRDEAIRNFGLAKASIVHRKGEIGVGERVVIVTCSAPHRKEAFKAVDWLVSELKKKVPIWKRVV